MEIELTNPPSDADVVRAFGVLADHGMTSRQSILLLATYGTAENGRALLTAAGIMAMTFVCACCGVARLDPSDKDATGLELCPRCFEEAGLENEHSDYGHAEPVKGCPSCP